MMSPIFSADQLRTLGEEGIIPSPNESEETFFEQVFLLKKTDCLKKIETHGEKSSLGNVLETWGYDFREILGAHPAWVPFTYSNQRLFFWQGAILWIFEVPMRGKIPIIQLRKQFKRGKLFGSSLKEVLLHESVHALRARFEEPRFEEILAYYHAPSKWRRFWGPFFRTPRHAWVSLFLMGCSLFFQTVSLLFYTDLLSSYLEWVPLFSLFDLMLKGALLIKDQRVFKQALSKVAHVFPHQKEVFPILLRLKDSEIQILSQLSVWEVSDYMMRKTVHSVRWRQIVAQFS